MFRVGHLSDLHATPVRIRGSRELRAKRLLGWISWQIRRSRVHRPDVLEALIEDLHRVAPDQIVVTGDLTNLACEQEFVAARAWLYRIGAPAQVSIVPGNHDAYVPIPRELSWDHWSEFLRSDPLPGAGGAADGGFPTLRVRGGAAFLGLCSAQPTPLGQATGALGEAQLARLERLLESGIDPRLCRILLLHHPPTEGAVSARRSLTDAPALRALLRRTGVDLVLHGHGHRTLIGAVEGPSGPIPVVGARSSSDVGLRPEKRAQYHLYEIEPETGGARRFRIRLRIRGWDPAARRFVAESEQLLVN
ncbi:MAG TPA: metallophosphoesterase [Myxococcota bacterium]|jgi:3',5'-cyclic AMP phosphodiesterase CpdA